MKKVEITPENALKAYKNATADGKKMLCNLLGNEIFTPKKITDRVKTFEDACEVLGLDHSKHKITVPAGILPDDLIAIIAFMELTIIARALNEGWIPDWNNYNQPKWYPYFSMSPGFGFGFSRASYDSTFTNTDTCSRLCFKTRKLAEYAGETFLDLYREYMINA